MNLPRALLFAFCTACSLFAAVPAGAQTNYPQSSDQSFGSTGPIRLRQSPETGDAARRMQPSDEWLERERIERRQRNEYRPGEFERYVQRLVDRTASAESDEEVRRRLYDAPSDFRFPQDAPATSGDMPQRRPQTMPADLAPQIRRLGAELFFDDIGDALDFSPLVPPDYIIAPGDEVALTIWGSVDADLRLVVDRSGRISVPRVGAVMVAGTRFADLADVISRQASKVFKNFQLSVALGQLRGVRVFVTGFVARPGAYPVSSLSTVVQALVRAGGPASAGSFRNVSLRRGNQPPLRLDLYDMLLRGDRSGDRLLQAGDVIHVEAVGPLVGLIGSVNKPAVFELKSGETVADVLRMAGGFNAVADTGRLAIERLEDRNAARITQLQLPQAGDTPLRNGDVLRAFSSVSVALPVQRQNKRVLVEGEVAKPGEYVLPPQSTIVDALNVAGGLTSQAYVYGTEFTRESVRKTQQASYERALRDLETDYARSNTTQRTLTPEEIALQQTRGAATQRLVERLRAIRPNGRVVLQLEPGSASLPELALEDGDRLYVPPQPTTVGVFGSVFNGGSYLHSSTRTLDDYLRLAGGPTRGADDNSVFVIRANGNVVSSRQTASWIGSNGRFYETVAQPGDTIFVPEEIGKTTFVQDAKDWTQILYQFFLGLAGLDAVRN